MNRALLPLATLVFLCGCDRKEEITPAPAPAPAPPRAPSSTPLSPPVSPAPNRTKTHAPHLTPATDQQREKAQREEAKVLAANIRNAVEQFHGDYDFLPSPASAAKGIDCESDTSAEEGLIMILKGMDITQNSRAADYLGGIKEASDEKGKRLSGLVRFVGEDEKSAAVVDPWGNYYRVLIDLDMDKTVLNPMEEALIDGAMPLLFETIIVWSSGPDGDANTWEDNVISWDPEKSRALGKPEAARSR